MKEETGQGLYIKMNTETGLVKCIEKMIERIVEEKLMKEIEDIKLGIDISEVMIDDKTEIVLDVVNVEKLTILLKIVLLCLNKKEKCIDCIIYNM